MSARLSPADIHPVATQIKELFEAGKTQRFIATVVGMTRPSVFRVVEDLRDAGFLPPKRETFTLNVERRITTKSEFAAAIDCLRCGNRFPSWDRRRNRLCENCRRAD